MDAEFNPNIADEESEVLLGEQTGVEDARLSLDLRRTIEPDLLIRHNQRWTPEEDHVVINNVENKLPRKLAAGQLGRTEAAISERVTRLRRDG